ncbi:MAG: alpha/beta fold hydrolase, partial [Bacteroidota bacterium]
MKTHLMYGLLFCLLFTACEQNTKEVETVREVPEYSIEQFLDTDNLFGGSFSADRSKILITSNRSGIYNIYEQPTDGGEATPITESDSSSIFGISYFPKDDRILFRMDGNGDEIFHLYMRDLEGNITELTPDEGARASFYGWAHDGNSFYYGYTKRDPRLTDVHEMNLETMTSKMIYQNDGAYSFNGISNDKKYMGLIKPVNTNDTDLFLYDFASQSMTKINENQAAHAIADFSTDSKGLYYTTDDGAEFSYLVRYDIAAGTREKAMESDWDISYAYFSYGGKYQIIGTNEDGRTAILVNDTESGKALEFPKFDKGDITNVSITRSEDWMAFYVGSSDSPRNLYTYNFETGQSKQLTNTLSKAINTDDLVSAEVVRYPSFDELQIPAIYYKPHQASAENKVPALVYVHGGPGGQSRQGYNAQIQYLVNHGYAVLAVNNRGSSGYGKTFYKMDDQNHGEKDLQDCVYGKKWLAQQSYIDSTKIGIIGGSYGGFMVMAALTCEPEVFDVGVNVFGVTNWLRTLKSIPPWWESFKDALYEEMGDPNTQDSARLYNISPLFHADQVTKPLMVLQGAQDPRVLQVESDEIVAAVRENDVPVEYVLFEDEGHGFVKKENQLQSNRKILEFLDTYLKQKEEIKG